MQKYELNVSRDFNAPAELIYDAWLDPEVVKEFMKPGDAVSVPAPIIDAKVGGKFQFDMHVGENVLPHLGEYRVLERASKIQFTWNSMNTNNEDSLVTIKITALDEKSCRLDLNHELLPTESAKSDHEGGWTNILKTLGENISK